MIKKRSDLVFLIDVDGTLSTGEYICDAQGKKYKIFGPDDTDALKILRKYLHIEFISGDKKGFKISKNRIVDHMGFKLTLVSSSKRIEWIERKFKKKKIIYMADGILDHLVFRKVYYSICPNNSDQYLKKISKYVSKCDGGKRAVADGCKHILKVFFKKDFHKISL
tara:strand:- start:140 stop:637 length:498 start_codon:yes stop_codon:yes gene_type:complete